MIAKIGMVTLPYGVQEEDETTNDVISVSTCPLGSPVIQVMGRAASEVSLTATVTKDVYEDIVDQQLGSPMVAFNAGGPSDSDYGIVIESIDKTRSSKLPNCYELDITAYKLDFTVENDYYDLSSGDYVLTVGNSLTTDPTDDIIDGYTTRLVLSSNEECSFWAQTSPDLSTWTDYPDTLGWVLDHEKRVIDISFLTGYIRVLAQNNGSVSSTINIKLFMTR
jgi:hypothetical protein